MATIVLDETDFAIAEHARRKFDWATDEVALEYRDSVSPDEWASLCAGWRVILEHLIRTTAATRAVARFLEPTASKSRAELILSIWEEHTGEWEGLTAALREAEWPFADIGSRFEVRHGHVPMIGTSNDFGDVRYGLQLAAEAYLLNPEGDWDIAELMSR